MPLAPRKDSAQATLLPPQGTTNAVPPSSTLAQPLAPVVSAETTDKLNAATIGKPKIKPIRAGFGQELTAYDQKLQRQIHRAGVWQAAVQCQAIVQYAGDFEAYKKLVRELANEGITYTEE